MSWEKIENHLFDKYCVEGEDKELQRLMEEHDKEIREQVVSELIDKVKDSEYRVSDNTGDTGYGIFTIELQEIANELIAKSVVNIEELKEEIER